MSYIKITKAFYFSLLCLNAFILLSALFLLPAHFLLNIEPGSVGHQVLECITPFLVLSLIGAPVSAWLAYYLGQKNQFLHTFNAAIGLIYPLIIILSMSDYLYYGNLEVSPMHSIEHLKQSPELWEEYLYFSLEPEEFVASINPDSNMNTNFHVYRPKRTGSGGSEGTSYYLDYFFVPFEEQASTASIWFMHKEISTRDSLGWVRRDNSEKFVQKFTDLLEAKETLFFMRSGFHIKGGGRWNYAAFALAVQKLGLSHAADRPEEEFLLLSSIESPQAVFERTKKVLFWVVLGFNILYVFAWWLAGSIWQAD